MITTNRSVDPMVSASPGVQAGQAGSRPGSDSVTRIVRPSNRMIPFML